MGFLGGKARNVGVIAWMEDLERIGMRYGDLLAVLDGMQIKAACSPLHDRDTYTDEDVRKWVRRHIDPDTGDLAEEHSNRTPRVGDPKKPHVHIMLRFPGPRTPQYCQDFFSEHFGQSLPCFRKQKFIKVDDPDTLLRYYAHMDTPAKAQYSVFDIVGFGGIDMSCLVKSDTNSKLKILCEIDAHMVKKGIKSYHRLCRWAFNTGNIDYINIVTGRASYFTGYFNSQRQDRMDAQERRKREQKDAECALKEAPEVPF